MSGGSDLDIRLSHPAFAQWLQQAQQQAQQQQQQRLLVTGEPVDGSSSPQSGHSGSSDYAAM
jgi:hypothetical protein